MTKKDRKINSDDLMSFTMAPSCANYDQFAIPKADRASANNLNTPTTNLLVRGLSAILFCRHHHHHHHFNVHFLQRLIKGMDGFFRTA